MYALQNKLTIVPLTPAKIQQSSRSFVGKKKTQKSRRVSPRIFLIKFDLKFFVGCDDNLPPSETQQSLFAGIRQLRTSRINVLKYHCK